MGAYEKEQMQDLHDEERDDLIERQSTKIKSDAKVIAALKGALEAIAQRSLDDPATAAHVFGHIAEHAIEQDVGK